MSFNLKTYNDIIKKDPANFIKTADSAYETQIEDIAKEIIAHREERPIILLSGPSGSGKTTTALTLEKYLDKSGYETHTLSLDNYFLPITLDEQKLLLEGKLDLESPQRIDIELLNRQIEQMINCESVELPLYDFKCSERHCSGKVLKRKPGELVIFEGTHALNPDVITLPDEFSTKIYVSVRTRISDENIVLHPSKIRLFRRMIRDKMYRNRAVEETLKMFDSVEIGEKKYIMPYKHRSTFDVDTFIPYEVSAYKRAILPELEALKQTDEVADLVKILQDIEPVSHKFIPRSSLVREFIGNSSFKY